MPAASRSCPFSGNAGGLPVIGQPQAGRASPRRPVGARDRAQASRTLSRQHSAPSRDRASAAVPARAVSAWAAMLRASAIEAGLLFPRQAQAIGKRASIAGEHLQAQKRIGSETILRIDPRHALEARNIAQKRGNNAQNAMFLHDLQRRNGPRRDQQLEQFLADAFGRQLLQPAPVARTGRKPGADPGHPFRSAHGSGRSAKCADNPRGYALQAADEPDSASSGYPRNHRQNR